jgi:hypothetical protein
MVMLFVVGGKPAYNVNGTMLVADAAAYNKLGQSAGAGQRGASQSTNMRGCADGKDWVDTRGRVRIELDVENLDRTQPSGSFEGRQLAVGVHGTGIGSRQWKRQRQRSGWYGW